MQHGVAVTTEDAAVKSAKPGGNRRVIELTKQLIGECIDGTVDTMGSDRLPQLGDVESVNFADPDPYPEAAKRHGPFRRRVPGPDTRVAIRLHGHPFTYAVRVTTDKQSGPQLTELTIVSDSHAHVDHGAMRSIPLRRLAYTAAQWIEPCTGLIAFLDSMGEVRGRPAEAAPDVYLAAQMAEQALALGMPVRPFVAKELDVSTRTVDRLLAKARAGGWFDSGPLPKRPQPRQRDVAAVANDY